MPWLEYNVHIRGNLTRQNVISVIVDFISPFVNAHRGFVSWHYLLEPNICGSSPGEVRLRFEGTSEIIRTIREDLTTEVRSFCQRTNLIMSEDENLGSHEGLHGNRTGHFEGATSETFGRDWDSIVRILQIGSETAIEILRLGRGLVEDRSINDGPRTVVHPYYLHLPANQLIIEP